MKSPRRRSHWSLLLVLGWLSTLPPRVPASDCNGNGAADASDISQGSSADSNLNGIPDECEAPPLELGSPTEIHLNGIGTALVEDLSGDGLPDLAAGYAPTGQRQGAALAVFLNRGQRRFSPPESITSPPLTRLAAGDVDRDGDLDLVGLESSRIWLFKNSGKGSFREAEKLCALGRVSSLSLGDLDGDPAADLVATSGSEASAWILLSRGNGEFASAISISTGSPMVTAALSDLDGDGDLDLAGLSSQGPSQGPIQGAGLQLFLNDGKGFFAAAGGLPSGLDQPDGLLMGDFNGDGRPDAAVSSHSSVAVLLNSPTGAFLASPPFLFRKGGMPFLGLAAADVDRDGDLDLAAGLQDAGGISEKGAACLLNRGDGTFQTSKLLSLGAPVTLVAARDLDGDQAADLLVSPLKAGGFRALWSGEAARASALSFETRTLHLGFEPHASLLGDLDGDHDLDLAVIDGETAVIILTNEGPGLPPTRKYYDVPSSSELIAITAADLDQDGDLDLVTADEATNRTQVLLNNGNGAFAKNGSYRIGERPVLVTTGDFNGDGLREILCVNQASNSLSLLTAQGGGAFRSPETLRAGGTSPLSAAVADFNQDGKLDIAVACYGSSLVVLFPGDGKGLFPYSGRSELSLSEPTSVIAVDLDGDGRPDLAAASESEGQVFTLFYSKGGKLTASPAANLRQAPHSIIAADLNGDGKSDLITANQYGGTLSLLINQGGTFSSPTSYRAGSDPRFAVAGDIDGDQDCDIVSANHTSLDLTYFLNQSAKAPAKPYLMKICTEEDFQAISIPLSSAGISGRQTKYIAPADPKDSTLLPTVFQNVSRAPVHAEFLAEAFPERFPGLTPEVYDRLTGKRLTRKYWSGLLYRLSTQKGPVYGFSIAADFLDDAMELPTAEEARRVFEALSGAVALRPLVYYPDTSLAQEAASRWIDPGFPVQVKARAKDRSYQPYTRGMGYGRVRVLRQSDFLDLNGKGALSFQDILVLEHAPRDIEGVVAGVITQEPQGELSHLAVRTARRGTPNCYLANAMSLFANLEGKLIRLEVREEGYKADEARYEDAKAGWEENRPEILGLPGADLDYGALDGLSEMDLSRRDSPPEARYGGKASNFARLQRVLSGPLDLYREPGFSIPMRHYHDFLRSNSIPSARDPARSVTYEEFLLELFAWREFQGDSRLRFEVLGRFRAQVEREGKVDPDLVARITRKVVEVFGSPLIPVRFRSSSNVEDALEFNGAGLYDSTSACVADDLDGDDSGPCQCDPRKPDERGIARAMKRVWASLWNFRAYEERAFYGISQETAAMAILVSTAFPDEKANGVAFTGNPTHALDESYVVTVQKGDDSVVSPEPGVLSEKDLLQMTGGRVEGVLRAQRSSRLSPEEFVLSLDELEELGGLLASIERDFPLDLDGHERGDVLLDVEFKITAEDCLTVKQVRPFLRQERAGPAPIFRLKIPLGTMACGAFVPSRSPERSYELKSTLRLLPGLIPLPASGDSFTATLIGEVRVGPSREIAAPKGPGIFKVTKVPQADATLYRFRYTQAFELPGGRAYEIEMSNLELKARGSQALEPLSTLDESLFSRGISLQGSLGELVVNYSSASFESFPLWEITAELEDGSAVSLKERHQPPLTLNDTGPAALVEASVNLRGTSRETADYWQLIYTSLRHNRGVRYRVILDPPVSVAGLDRPVHAVEVVAPEPRLGVREAVRYLGEAFEELASPSVTSFQRKAGAKPSGEP
jgi:hypothetical protein